MLKEPLDHTSDISIIKDSIINLQDRIDGIKISDYVRDMNTINNMI
jgi:hypothetical protein